MIKDLKQRFIQEEAARGSMSWSDHAIGCLIEDDLIKDEVVHALRTMDYILIVANYRPTLEKWEHDYRTRKRRR